MMVAPQGTYRPFRTKKVDYLSFYAERLGSAAAGEKWREARFRSFTQLSQLVWYPLLAIGLWNRITVLIVPGAAIGGIAVVTCALMFWAQHRVYVLASAHLGRKINWRSSRRRRPAPGTHPSAV